MKVSLRKLFFNKGAIKRLILPLLGLFLSMILIPFLFQVTNDINSVVSNEEGEFQYIQISKEVGISTSLGLGSINFSEKDIAKLKQQEFIEEVGAVKSNNFRVYVKAPKGFHGSFDGYMHAVPDDFLDDKPTSFSWEEGQREVPVIIPNQFFTLLNAGILPSQGHAPIPKVLIKQFSLKAILGSGSNKIEVKVRVVGFTDRVTTVVVPNSFLEWSNKKLAPEKPAKSTMAILKIKDSGDPKLEKYLVRHDYEVNKEQLVVQKGKWIAQVIIGVLLILGIIITFLSLNSIILFVQLVVVKSLRKIEMLLMLGYKTSQVQNTIVKSLTLIIIPIVLLAWSIVLNIISTVHSQISSYTAKDLEVLTGVHLIILFGLISIVALVYLAVKKAINKYQ